MKVASHSITLGSDTILDIKGIGKKYNTDIPQEIVPTHFATIKLKNVICQMYNLYRHVLEHRIPTKRLSDITIKCDDPNAIAHHVKTRLMTLRLPRNTPLGRIKLDVKHTFNTPAPIDIDTRMFKCVNSSSTTFDKLFDGCPIMELGVGKSCTIEAIVTESTTNIESDERFNEIINFDITDIVVTNQDGKEKAPNVPMDIEYNSGNVVMMYQDNITLKELMAMASNTIKEYLQMLLNSLEDFQKNASGYIICDLPDDQSTIIAHTILAFIYIHTDGNNGNQLEVKKHKSSSRIILTSNDPNCIKNSIQFMLKYVNEIKF